jgi:hypothetical protein
MRQFGGNSGGQTHGKSVSDKRKPRIIGPIGIADHRRQPRPAIRPRLTGASKRLTFPCLEQGLQVVGCTIG